MRLLLGAALMLVAGCGQEEKSATTENETAAIAVAPQTAAEIVALFKAADLPVQDVKVLDEASDSNNLLGRPGQYTSKVFFYDARHPNKNTPDDEGENTVEVFATAADAKARHDYIEGVTKGVSFLVSYQVLRGNVLVRFDKVLLPTEVEQYKAALTKAGVQ